ncbi:unnamed protein product [Spirodela intermedia]|uniref:Uncharacterized protein n=1 Tax=Spirodela intermedia TaxID=51605 RepID=A0A7I8J0L0_SPIIN|nr:unnamed protein product [Spirodela intermedia]CAA6663774.1 unnamed protein product [Spirodela intermedia]
MLFLHLRTSYAILKTNRGALYLLCLVSCHLCIQSRC